MSSPLDEEPTLLTPPNMVDGEISETRPAAPEPCVNRTVALPSGEHPAPPGHAPGDEAHPSLATGVERRAGPSTAVVLALSVLMFLFTAAVGFTVVWLALR